MKNKNNLRTSAKVTLAEEIIHNKIYLIRGQKVMLDFDLADLYQVKTKVLNQAVKRNSKRFPSDFVFQLDEKDETFLRSQFVTAKSTRRRTPIFAFTEQGVAMLSSVLRSDHAIQVNIQIMRTFTKLRQMLLTHKELKQKIEELERKYDGKFKIIFDVIGQLLDDEKKPKEKIGFNI